MALSYNRMWKLLVDKKMSKADLRKAADIAPNTMTKLRRDETVNLAILGRICIFVSKIANCAYLRVQSIFFNCFCAYIF